MGNQMYKFIIMKKAVVLFYLVFITLIGCSSTDNCKKTITIPSITIITPSGSSYTPASQSVVPCDYVITPVQEQTPLQNFTYEVLNFTFTPDTGNNTNRLKFDIKLNNPNNFVIRGFVYITTNADGVESSSGFLNGAISTCSEINPNSSCIFSFDKQALLSLGLIQSIQLVNVKYYLTN
jgi:hypothetical protein